MKDLVEAVGLVDPNSSLVSRNMIEEFSSSTIFVSDTESVDSLCSDVPKFVSVARHESEKSSRHDC